MLRVGLTGSLGSGKSTVAGFLRELGAEVIESDLLGRELMEPGQNVFAAIVARFGSSVVGQDGRLNRPLLADLAFKEGHLQDLNAIIHPAVIAAQRTWMDAVFVRSPLAVAVVESALIFEVERDALARGEQETVLADWRRRIDRMVVVTAPDDLKITRYAARISPSAEGRAAAEADARLRLSHQIPDAEKAVRADYLLDNSADLASLRIQVIALWKLLQTESNKFPAPESLK